MFKLVTFLIVLVMFAGTSQANPTEQLYKALQNATPEQQQKIYHTLQQLSKVDLSQDKYILVNIPAYTLYAVENNTVVLESKTIVGRKGAKTPVMTSNLYAIKYNPDWNAPPGISRNYNAKIARGEWKYFQNRNIKVIPRHQEVIKTINGVEQRVVQTRYHFYQPPGINNALGLLKFELDNGENIYLHDTNERHLFDSNKRAESSGCVRVQNWQQLAAWVAHTTTEQIQYNLNTRRTYIEQVNPIPVHLVYFLAWPDHNGQVLYYEDVYKRLR